MAEKLKCRGCGAEVESDSPGSDCVQCLLRLGLAWQGEDSDGPSIVEGTTFEAIIDTNGNVTLLQPVRLAEARRAMVTVLQAAAASSTVVAPGEGPTGLRSSWRLHYDLIHPLGAGGMGRTLKVRDRHTGRVLCLKEIRPEVDKRNLVQECRALARLGHPRLVRLLNFDSDARIPYLVMEFVEGMTLADYLRGHGRLSGRSVIHLAEQLFETMAYVHLQELIHRDLKPGNIMLKNPVEDLVPVIIDFGLAIVDRRDLRDLETSIGSIAGTASYMAPEQLEAKELTAACDVYSLGQIMWEMTMGREAFTSYRFSELARKMTMPAGLEIPREERVSSGLASIIRQCTRREPKERPTAEEVLQRLQKLRADFVHSL